MGHYCRICDRMRPNEQFSGKGHKTHVCKRCQKLPKQECNAIDQEREIFDFMEQSGVFGKMREVLAVGSGAGRIVRVQCS